MHKLLAIFVILFITFIATISGARDNTDCDPTKVPVLNGTSGSLTIALSESALPGKTCEWIINTTSLNTTGLLHLDIEELILGANDALRVTKNDANHTLLFESKGFQWPGVILVPNTKEPVRVTLVLSTEVTARKFDVGYNTKDTSAQLQNIESTGRFIFAYYQNGSDINTNFNITLRVKDNTKKLLLNIEKLIVGDKGFVTFDKVYKYTTSNTFDNKTTGLPDFVLSNGQQINVQISQFQSKANSMVIFNYELVDDICSLYNQTSEIDQKDEKINLNLPNTSALQTLSSYRCLTILEHSQQSAKFLLDLSAGTFKFINTGDIITVLDGMSSNSRSLAVIDSTFLDLYWSSTYILSSSNKIWILYNSPQVVNRERNVVNTVGIRPISQGGSFWFTGNTTKTTLAIDDKSKPITPVVYTFVTSSTDDQIIIDFEEDKKLPGYENQTLMTIYGTSSRSGRPLISLRGNTYPPDILTSNTNELKVQFNQIVNFKADVYSLKKGCNSSVFDTSYSYNLTACNNLCSWLIPRRDNSSGTFVLKFSHIYLPLKSDSIEIIRLKPLYLSVLKLNGPINVQTFPDLNLDSNYSYILYTRRSCANDSIDSSKLLGVSFIYVEQNIVTHQTNITADPKQVIAAHSYPNYYSVGSDHLWQINGNNSQKAFITFTDLDLLPNHDLTLSEVGDKSSTTFTNASQLTDIPDFVVTVPVSLNLSAHSIDTQNPFSARGFNASVEAISCGNYSKVYPNNSTIVITPDSLTNISKCIWIVSTTEAQSKGKLNLLQFTVSKGKDFNKNILQIYDSNAIRTNKTVNTTDLTKPLTSSTNSIVILYSITDPKNDNLLKFNFTQTVCDVMCPNNKRCFLPQFKCNGVNDCGDFSDEYNCNSTGPVPTPTPEKIYVYSGVNGWVVFLVICPISIGLGIMGTLYGPTLLGRFRRGRYREFQDFSEVS